MSNKKPGNFILMMDFSNLTSAKQFAITLMDQRIQFSFSPEPLSISYPIKAAEALEKKNAAEPA